MGEIDFFQPFQLTKVGEISSQLFKKKSIQQSGRSTTSYIQLPIPEQHPRTPPKFNIAPENWSLEDYFPIAKVTFQELC